MKLFGIKKPVTPNLVDSIQRLREAEGNLEKREKYLERLMDQANQEAKRKIQSKDKRGALFQIKKKKIYETQLQQINGKKSNIEVQIMALENAGLTNEIITAMQGGEQALRQMFTQHKIEKVDDVMESITETMDDIDEMNKIISEPIGPPIDEDALAVELDQLETDLADEMMNNLSLPTIPINSIAVNPMIVEPLTTKSTTTNPIIVQATTNASKSASKSTTGGVKLSAKLANKEEKELQELNELMGM